MLPSAIAGSIVTQVLTWQNEAGTTIDLSNLTITGTLQPVDAPDNLRNIVGALQATDAAAGKFGWTYAVSDTVAGIYLVQFTAQGGGSVLHSFSDYWVVQPAGGIHPYSLAGLRIRLMEQLVAYRGIPNAYQYTQAILDAINAVSWSVPAKRQVLLNVMSGTDSYALPDDFLFEISLVTDGVPGQIGYDSAGKLVAHSYDHCETHYVNGKTLTFVPTPGYTGQRRLWYAAGYLPGSEGVYQFMTEDIARLVLLKAEAGLLRLQAREISSKSGISYQIGDMRVDKKGKAEAFAKLAAEKESEYQRALSAQQGQQGMAA